MKKSTRIFAALLAAVLVLLMAPVSTLAADAYEITSFDRGYWGPEDTPLLVILVNYDPSGNGADGEYGEQMLRHNDHSYWSELLFGNGKKGLKAYFEEQSGGNFRFIPAAESYANTSKKNKVNDGIVEVSVQISMDPNTSATTSDPERYSALAEAVAKGYVDFSKYDKNGDKRIDESELVIAYIAAGYEVTRNSNKPSYNAHMSSFGGYEFNGVSVSTDYIKVGEIGDGNSPLTVGSFCHELGHVLGNGDLYATYSTGTWGGYNSPAGTRSSGGALSIMAAYGSAGYNASKNELKGESPVNYDPFHAILYGFRNCTVVGNGEYTLYSHQSGKYNIIKIATPNPNEYYLVENRYFDSNSSFDSEDNAKSAKGIIIWHVDQSIADAGLEMAGMPINSYGKNPDIGVAALSPAKEGDNWNPATAKGFTSKDQTFDCKAYQFPGSGTWYTSMDEAEAALFDLNIEIVTDIGHETKIKITGVPDVVSPQYKITTTNQDSDIKMVGNFVDLNRQTLTDVVFELSDSKDFTNILKSVSVKPDSTGKFSATFEALPDGEYYTRVMIDTKEGEYFSAPVRSNIRVNIVENTTKYTATFYRDPETNKRTYSQIFQVGEPFAVGFPMSKTGYVFAGWYEDAEYTTYFDTSKIKNDHQDITLYAKWVKEEAAAKLTVVGATVLTPKADATGYTAIGECFHEPAIVIPEGKELIGWYADEALTIPFSFDTPAEGGEVMIYAKWEDEVAETTTETSVQTETTATGEAEMTTATSEEITTPAANTSSAESTASENTSAESSSEESASAEQTTEFEASEQNGMVVGVVAAAGVAAISTAGFLFVKKKK